MVESSAPLEELLCEISLDSGLEQLVENPTRGSNTLDLIFTNSISLLGDVEVVDSIPGTDHDAFHFSLFGKRPPATSNRRRIVYGEEQNLMESSDRVAVGFFPRKGTGLYPATVSMLGKVWFPNTRAFRLYV